MALQGQCLCVGTSGKQEQQWLNGTLLDLEFHCLVGPTDTDRAHYSGRLWRPTEKCLVRHSTHMIQWGNCRLESRLKLNDGSAHSDEILC